MSNNIYFFNGTMLVSSGEIKLKNQIHNIIAFQQTDKKREAGKEYPDAYIKPEMMFVFDTIDSVDSVIRVLQHLKENWR